MSEIAEALVRNEPDRLDISIQNAGSIEDAYFIAGLQYKEYSGMKKKPRDFLERKDRLIEHFVSEEKLNVEGGHRSLIAYVGDKPAGYMLFSPGTMDGNHVTIQDLGIAEEHRGNMGILLGLVRHMTAFREGGMPLTYDAYARGNTIYRVMSGLRVNRTLADLGYTLVDLQQSFTETKGRGKKAEEGETFHSISLVPIKQ